LGASVWRAGKVSECSAPKSDRLGESVGGISKKQRNLAPALARATSKTSPSLRCCSQDIWHRQGAPPQGQIPLAAECSGNLVYKTFFNARIYSFDQFRPPHSRSRESGTREPQCRPDRLRPAKVYKGLAKVRAISTSAVITAGSSKAITKSVVATIKTVTTTRTRKLSPSINRRIGLAIMELMIAIKRHQLEG
jgi:hypothetical protein